MLALEDLKEMSEDEVKGHIINIYSGDSGWGDSIDITESALEQVLDELDILIAYESVGSWGCDSSSFFLLRNKKTGKLYEVHASHCSCFGFEGQFTPEESDIRALKLRVQESTQGSVFYVGGYDNDEEGNYKAVNEYILNQL